MNEKYKQYYNIQNDKALIERKVPTERDLEKFNQWKVLKREQLKNTCLGMSIAFLIIVVIRNSFRKFIWNNTYFNLCLT